MFGAVRAAEQLTGRLALLALLLSLMVVYCCQTAGMQAGSCLPQEGSGGSGQPSPYQTLLERYSSQVCRVLASFDAIDSEQPVYSLTHSPALQAQACEQLRNRTQTAAATASEDQYGCRMRLECKIDNSRFPPVTVSGRCINNYCGRVLTGDLQPCRPKRRLALVLRYQPPAGQRQSTVTSLSSMTTGRWRLFREIIVTDCYCGSQ